LKYKMYDFILKSQPYNSNQKSKEVILIPKINIVKWGHHVTFIFTLALNNVFLEIGTQVSKY